MEAEPTTDSCPGKGALVCLLQSLSHGHEIAGKYAPWQKALPATLPEDLSPANQQQWADRFSAVATVLLSDGHIRRACFLSVNAAILYEAIEQIPKAIDHDLQALEIQHAFADATLISSILERIGNCLVEPSPLTENLEIRTEAAVGRAELNWGNVEAARQRFETAGNRYDLYRQDNAGAPGIVDVERDALVNRIYTEYTEGLSVGEKAIERRVKRIRGLISSPLLRGCVTDTINSRILLAQYCLVRKRIDLAEECLAELRETDEAGFACWDQLNRNLLEASVLKSKGESAEARELALTCYRKMKKKRMKLPVLPPGDTEMLLSPKTLLGQDHEETGSLTEELTRAPLTGATTYINGILDTLQSNCVDRYGPDHALEYLWVQTMENGVLQPPRRVKRAEAEKLKSGFRRRKLALIADDYRQTLTTTDKACCPEETPFDDMGPRQRRMLNHFLPSIWNGKFTCKALSREVEIFTGYELSSDDYSQYVRVLKKLLNEDLKEVIDLHSRNETLRFSQEGWAMLWIREKLNRRHSQLYRSC